MVSSTLKLALETCSDQMGILQVLQLSKSPDLVCMNMMCEKVGKPCLCRLSVALQKLGVLRTLELAGNQIAAVPDAVAPEHLPELRRLDISNNRIAVLPARLPHFQHLQVRHRGYMWASPAERTCMSGTIALVPSP